MPVQIIVHTSQRCLFLSTAQIIHGHVGNAVSVRMQDRSLLKGYSCGKECMLISGKLTFPAGGLGDVMGALPKALARRGHRVMVVIPRYSNYEEGWDTSVRRMFRVMGSDTEASLSLGSVRIRYHEAILVVSNDGLSLPQTHIVLQVYPRSLYMHRVIGTWGQMRNTMMELTRVEMTVCASVQVGYFHGFIDGVDYVFVDHACYHGWQDNIYGGDRQQILFRCHSSVMSSIVILTRHVGCVLDIGHLGLPKELVRLHHLESVLRIYLKLLKQWAEIMCLWSRCALLCKAALEAPWHVPCGGVPYGDNNLVFIANDWHTALLPVYLQVRFCPVLHCFVPMKLRLSGASGPFIEMVGASKYCKAAIWPCYPT